MELLGSYSRTSREGLKLHVKYWRFLRLAVLLTADALVIAACYYGAFVLRLEDLQLSGYLSVFIQTLPAVLVVHFTVFVWGGMYREVWRLANIKSAMVVFRSEVLAVSILIIANLLIQQDPKVPRSIPFIGFVTGVLALIAVRFSWRIWRSFHFSGLSLDDKERCLVYGAGRAGELLARNAATDPNFPYVPVGFIDDDHNKKGRTLHGLKILGQGSDLGTQAAKHRIKTIILAVPSASGKKIRDLVEVCQSAGLKLLIMPDFAGSLSTDPFKPRNVDVRDLLSRTPKTIDVERVTQFFAGQTVLITGAGGSIGSELCRQISRLKPSKLILLDSAEYNLYRIDQELRDLNIEGVTIVSVLGSAVELTTAERVFKEHNPTCVVHAAAYKHVSLVEQNPLAGIINNVLGTKVIAETALAFGVKHFLLISTDKAVRPTSIMGASKRCCELLIQSLYLAHAQSCNYSAVRFGNVLGSSGSVIPRFSEQIQSGGNLTVTHPEVTRYFMLIPEAVGLCLQSLTMAKGGEIFVLNMGEPIKIYEMAKQLIFLAGKKLGRDIDIVFTGLKQGEKLYEELILEGVEEKTQHEDVFVAKPLPINAEAVLADINRLLDYALRGQQEDCMQLLKQMTLLEPHAIKQLAIDSTKVPADESQSANSLTGGIAAALSF